MPRLLEDFPGLESPFIRKKQLSIDPIKFPSRTLSLGIDGATERFTPSLKYQGIREYDPTQEKDEYDYRGAFAAGERPEIGEHWSSDHPNRYVDGVDTITGDKSYAPLPPRKSEEFRDKSQLSNIFATAARAIGPESWGGRLGEGVLEMNKRNLEALQTQEKEDVSRGIYEMNRRQALDAQRLRDENLEAKRGMERSLTVADSSGKTPVEKMFPDNPALQGLFVSAARLDPKLLERVLDRPDVEAQNKAILGAYESVDVTKDVDEQRKQFTQKFVELNPRADVKDIVSLAKIIITDKASLFGSQPGKMVEDRSTIVARFGEGSQEVKDFDKFAEKRVTPIPASVVNQGMNIIDSQIKAVTGMYTGQLEKDEKVQNLRLKVQEMLQEGKSVDEAWKTIEKEVPKKVVEPEELNYYERFKKWISEFSGKSTQAPTKTPIQAPTIGEIRKGYKFKGGDPSDRNNWEKTGG